MRSRKNDIEKYLRGKLSSSEMHALEKEALNDPFLSEALEGIEHAGADNFLYDLHRLNKSVHDRMRKKARNNNKTIRIWGWTSAVAATLLLLAVSGFLVVKILKDQQTREHSMKTAPGKTQVTAEKDSSSKVSGDSSRLTLTEGDKAIAEGSRGGGIPSLKDDREQGIASKRSDVSHEVLADATLRAKEEGTPTAGSDDDLKKESPLEIHPLARAEVSGQDSLVQHIPGSEQSGARGRLEGKAAGVEVQRRAAQTKTKEIPLNKENLNVTLEEDITVLSEVVIDTGSAPEVNVQASAFQVAEPEGGMIDFKNYLANAVKYPQEAIINKTEGKVTVRFTVEPDGELTDFEVVKGIGSGCENELVRAIREGPEWKPGKRGDQQVEDKIMVEFRFNLLK